MYITVDSEVLKITRDMLCENNISLSKLKSQTYDITNRGLSEQTYLATVLMANTYS